MKTFSFDRQKFLKNLKTFFLFFLKIKTSKLFSFQKHFLKIGKIFLGIVFLAHFSAANAANPPEISCPDFLPGCREGVSDSPQDHFFFRDTLPKILNWLMALGAAGAVLMGVIAGAMYLFAGADEELLTRAHKTGIFALIGLVLAMFAFFIVEIINRLPFPNSPL